MSQTSAGAAAALHATEAETTTESKRLSGLEQLSKGQLRSLTVVLPRRSTDRPGAHQERARGESTSERP